MVVVVVVGALQMRLSPNRETERGGRDWMWLGMVVGGDSQC